MKKRDWLLTYVIIFIVLVVFRIIGPTQPFFDWTVTTTRLANAILILSLGFILLQISSIIFKDPAHVKIAHYLILAGTAAIILFAYYQGLLALSISLGVIAVVITFIFQTPLLSFFAWIYLSMGKIYIIGDRIRVGDIKGDVIHIDPLRTKVLEIGGEYVAADLPSGRIVTFPNSLVLSKPVHNYIKRFPYIWVDIPFNLSPETDFDFVKTKIEQIIRNHIKERARHMQRTYEYMLKVFELADRKFVDINFNLTPYWTWIELRVTFPVVPKEQSKTMTEITEKILQMFKKYPSKVRFPQTKAR